MAGCRRCLWRLLPFGRACVQMACRLPTGGGRLKVGFAVRLRRIPATAGCRRRLWRLPFGRTLVQTACPFLTGEGRLKVGFARRLRRVPATAGCRRRLWRLLFGQTFFQTACLLLTGGGRLKVGFAVCLRRVPATAGYRRCLWRLPFGRVLCRGRPSERRAGFQTAFALRGLRTGCAARCRRFARWCAAAGRPRGRRPAYAGGS